eukprot:c16308_g1_i1.p1 GENE.c16308_g1_i1~~c16308_g1_i1.p1  ORF type:complete len:303 (+),score=59.73 c16308_g1_i1:85-993(+)
MLANGRSAHAIKNKAKRFELFAKARKEKSDEKRSLRAKRKREEEELGDQAPPKKVPKTIESTRAADETHVAADDEEVAEVFAADKFAAHFDGRQAEAKIMFTTSKYPTKHLFPFLKNLVEVFPNAFYYKRGTFEIKKIVEHASARGFTDIVIVAESKCKPVGLYIIHLPTGPTAFFKISTPVLTKHIANHGRLTDHKPELIVNNMTTQLGLTIGRMFASLIPRQPQFEGRRVITFHNQRDFIFFRHHRYIFEGGKRVRMQELGPRFTLKLRWLQHGTFDTKQGEYEWVYSKKLDASRLKFAL